MSEIPDDLKYTKTHEWIRIEDDGTVTVGITDHAQESLGDLVFVELPTIGQLVTAEETCGVVESVKAASDILSPISGEIIAGNDTLTDEPELVNSSPYEAGWLFKLKPDEEIDLKYFSNAEEYAEFIESEK